jgi:hypothetical protein
MVWLLSMGILWAMESPKWGDLNTEQGWERQSVEHPKGVESVAVDKKILGPMPCFRGTAHTNVAPRLLMDVVMDTESAMDWAKSDLDESIELGRNENVLDYYQYLDIPIFSDRFWFLRATIEEENGLLRFRWERLIDGGPYATKWNSVRTENPSAVEPPINIGAWEFAPIEGKTRVRYIICTHPGGSVPLALQSIGTEQTLPGNIRDLIVHTQKHGK